MKILFGFGSSLDTRHQRFQENRWDQKTCNQLTSIWDLSVKTYLNNFMIPAWSNITDTAHKISRYFFSGNFSKLAAHVFSHWQYDTYHLLLSLCEVKMEVRLDVWNPWEPLALCAYPYGCPPRISRPLKICSFGTPVTQPLDLFKIIYFHNDSMTLNTYYMYVFCRKLMF